MASLEVHADIVFDLLESTLFCEVVERVRSEPLSVILVVPTRRRVRSLERALRERIPGTAGRGIIPPRVFTWADLVDDLFPLLGSARRAASRAERLLLMQSVLESVGSRLADWSVEEIDRVAGITLEALRLVDELKAAGVCGDVPVNVRVIRDAYEKQMAVRRLADANDRIRMVCEALGTSEQGAGLLGGVRWVVVEGFYDLTEAQEELLRALSRNVRVSVAVSLAKEHLPVFEPTRKMLDHLRAPRPKYQDTTSAQPGHDLAFAMARELAWQPEEAKPKVADGFLSKIEGGDRADEVSRIARSIKTRLLRGEVQADRICAAFADLDAYLPLVRDVFDSYGIPINVTRGYPLSESAAARSALALVDLVEGDFSYRALCDLADIPYVHVTCDADDSVCYLTGADFAEAGQLLSLTRGKNSWREQVSAHRRLLESKREREPEDDRLLGLLQRLEGALERLVGIVEPLEAQGRVDEHVERLQAALDELGVPEAVFAVGEPRIPPEVIGRDVRGWRAFASLLDELIRAAGRLSLGAIGPSAFRRLLSAALAGRSYHGAGSDDGGVRIMDLHETRTLHFEVVYLAGILEGRLPERLRPYLLLESPAAEALGLRSRERTRREGRHRLVRLLCQAHHRLILCYPTTEDGAAVIRSALVDEIRSLLGTIPEEPVPEEALSRKDALVRFGAQVRKDGPREALRLHTRRGSLPDELRRAASAVAVEQLRSSGTESCYSGVLSAGEAPVALAARFGSDYVASGSALELYIECPFRFFVRYGLGVRETEEPGEEIDARQRGSLIHGILCDFFERWRNEHGGPVTDAEAARLLIREVASKHLDAIERGGPFGQAFVRGLMGGEDRRGLFDAFIECECAAARERAFAPWRFEFAFGYGDVAPLELGSGEEGVLLRGRADRIDRDADGDLIIYDYKTGRVLPGMAAIERGESLQLPIYALAARELFNAKSRDISAGYYHVRSRNEVRSAILLGPENNVTAKKDAKSLEKVLEIARDRVTSAVGQIRQGRFAPTQRAAYASCDRCEASIACRRAGV